MKARRIQYSKANLESTIISTQMNTLRELPVETMSVDIMYNHVKKSRAMNVPSP